jgi:hypothetical protein
MPDGINAHKVRNAEFCGEVDETARRSARDHIVAPLRHARTGRVVNDDNSQGSLRFVIE